MRQTEDSLLCLPVRKAKLYVRRWWVLPVIISRNHRIAEGDRDCRGHKQGLLELFAQDCA